MTSVSSFPINNANGVSNAISPTTMADAHVNTGCAAGGRLGESMSASNSEPAWTNKLGSSSNGESVARKLEASLSPEAIQKIESLLVEINRLEDKQKLWLYLQLPGGAQEPDPFCKKSSSPTHNSTRVEQTTAANWIRSHLEEFPDTSLPKQEVYEEYRNYCDNSNLRPLSTADFGKIIKSVFPAVLARRLGARGNSRYCYSGVRKKVELKAPALSPLEAPAVRIGADILQGPCPSCPPSLCHMDDDHVQTAAAEVICEWASGVMNKQFSSTVQLAQHLASNKAVTSPHKSVVVIQSHMEGQSRVDMTPEMRHRETNIQLKQALQYRQEIRKKQAEENQQRLQTVTSPGIPVGAKQSVDVASTVTAPLDGNAMCVTSRTDKGTQLEQKDVATMKEVSGTITPSFVDIAENSTHTDYNTLPTVGTSTSDGLGNAAKDSPSKRRFAPIQPKTPVRDSNPQVLLLTSPPSKNVNGQPVQFVVMNGQKVVQLQNIPNKLTSPQQVNVLLQGQHVFQSPVQTVAAVANPTSLNVVGSPVVGSPAAASIQSVIKSGQVVLVGNTLKPVQGVCSNLQTITNSNTTNGQSPRPNVTPSQVAVVAQAAPPQAVTPTSNVACQKTVFSPQGISLNTGTNNMRSPSITPVIISQAIPVSAPPVTSPITVMAQPIQNTKLVSAQNIIVRTATSSSPNITNSYSVVANGLSTSTTSVTFATQPMKLLSSLAVMSSDSFQGSSVASVAPSKPAGATDTVTKLNGASGSAMANSVIDAGRSDVAKAASRVAATAANTTASATELLRNMSNTHKLGVTGAGKTVASLLRNAHATTALASPSLTGNKALTPSTGMVASSRMSTAAVQVSSQAPSHTINNKVFLQAPQGETGNTHIAGISETALASALASLRNANIIAGNVATPEVQANTRNILSSILTQGNLANIATSSTVQLQQMAIGPVMTNAGGGGAMLNPSVAQPSVSLLTDVDQNPNPMLMVSGMSTATMLPQKSKPEETTSSQTQIPQIHAAVAASSTGNSQTITGLTITYPNISNSRQATPVPQGAQVATSGPGMLERLLASEDLAYNVSPLTEMRSTRSVPSTPIAELQSPPHIIRAQSVAVPLQQQGTGSVPPSPGDSKSFAFMPINAEQESEESPLKPKHRPKPTHPQSHNLLNQALTINGDTQNQNVNNAAKGRGKRVVQPEFVTPTRKRRLSSNSRRTAAASPYIAQPQHRPGVTSPAPTVNRSSTPLPTLQVQSNPVGLSVSTAIGNVHINPINPEGNPNSQQLMWQRRRNPSGPACPGQLSQLAIAVQNQQQLETQRLNSELQNLLSNASNLNEVLSASSKRALQSRSQSVPLPEQPANRLLGYQPSFQYSQQSELVQNQNVEGINQNVASQVQIIPMITADQVRLVQSNQTNTFAAKRNLTQDLLEINVTEDDFAMETFNPMLNSDLNTASNIDQVPVLNDTSWSNGQDDAGMTADSNVAGQISDFNLKYDGNVEHNGNTAAALSQNQSLLPSQVFNDTSNSTASSISESIGMIDDLPDNMFQDLNGGQGFDLPTTPWQMGASNACLSTLEC